MKRVLRTRRRVKMAIAQRAIDRNERILSLNVSTYRCESRLHFGVQTFAATAGRRPMTKAHERRVLVLLLPSGKQAP